MIVVPGKNPLGNVVHLVLGPESELFLDMNGAAIASLDDTLAQFDSNRPIFVSITRTRNEADTVSRLQTSGALFHDSFKANPETGKVHATHAKGTGPMPGVPPRQGPKPAPNLEVGKCQLCSQQTRLLPIPGLSICVTCAKIEIGKTLVEKQKQEEKASKQSEGQKPDAQ